METLLNEVVHAAPAGVMFYGEGNDILENVNPLDVIRGLTPNEAAVKLSAELTSFAKFCTPTVSKLEFPPLMQGMWNTVIDGAAALQNRRGDMQLALGIPRGFAKTQLVKLIAAYLLTFTRHTFIAVAGSSEKNAQNITRDIISILDQPHYIALFGDWKQGIRASNNELRHFLFRGKECVIVPKGSLTAIRGLNIDGRRPDVIILDDIIGEEEAKSEIQSAAIYDWMINTLLPAASTDGSISLYLGNMYNAPGCILSKLKADVNWVTVTLGAILADGTSLWEQLHPIKKLLRNYNAAVSTGHEADWLAQYMNGSQSDISKSVDLTVVRENYYNRFGMLEPEYQGAFIIVDPSGDKSTSDDTAVVAAGISDGYPIARKVSSSIKNPMDTIKTAIKFALQYGAQHIFVESVAYQATLIFWANYITDMLKLRDVIFWHEIQPDRTSKTGRILTSFDELMKGQYYIAPTMWSEYKAEALAFDKLSTRNKDNILDAVHYMPKIVLLYGRKIVTDYSSLQFTRLMSNEQQNRNGILTLPSEL